MIGSLNKVWPWKEAVKTFTDRHGEIKPLVEQNILPARYTEITGTNPQLIYALLLAAFGFALIFILEGLSKKLNK